MQKGKSKLDDMNFLDEDGEDDNSFDFDMSDQDDDFGDAFEPEKPKVKSRGLGIDVTKHGFKGKEISIVSNVDTDLTQGQALTIKRSGTNTGFDPTRSKKVKKKGRKLKKVDDIGFFDDNPYNKKENTDGLVIADNTFGGQTIDLKSKVKRQATPEQEIEESSEEEESEESLPPPPPKKKKSKKKRPKTPSSAEEEEDSEEDPNGMVTDRNNGKEKKKVEDMDFLEEDSGEDEEEVVEEDIVEIQIAKLEDLDLSDMNKFLTSPPPKGKMVQCTIMRDKSSFAKKMSPKYHVYLSHHEDCYLMTGKKRGIKARTSYFIGSSKKGLKKNSQNVVGKISSNFVGTEFHCYTQGKNPKKTKNVDQIREEVAVVRYEKNMFGMKGPRKMFVYIPGVNNDGTLAQFKPLDSKDNLFKRYKSGKRDGIAHLINKPPKWSAECEAFVLDFYGRVKKPSVKNF